MTIANVEIGGSPTRVPCIGHGQLIMVGVSCTLTATKSHPVTPWLTALGVTDGKVLAIYDASTNGPAMTVNGVGAGITPYIDYTNQVLEFRRPDTGAIEAVNTAIADPDRVKFWIVVRD